MKITTDVNYAGMRPAGSVSSRVQVPVTSGTTNLNNQQTGEITAKLQRDRAMIDALTIAQSSRALIQKAMDISARMRTIAYQAMTTGNVNMQELGTEIAGIQGTMQTYGEIISVPVSNSPGRGALPDNFTRQLADMGVAADQLVAGNRVDPETFSQISSTLSAFSADNNKKISEIASGMGLSEKHKAAMNNEVDASRAAELLVTNPEMSLTVQGNINPEVVKVLTAV
ncbi:MAG TPA: hypothetical protein PK986_03205 [Spirochaetota bacterium]|nr:hypothetical protein [Spirochaetota bacterium]HQO39457.1 hypothetical protein [Spirochaetota bacterium]